MFATINSQRQRLVFLQEMEQKRRLEDIEGNDCAPCAKGEKQDTENEELLVLNLLLKSLSVYHVLVVID
jgi:hypothetical protein